MAGCNQLRMCLHSWAAVRSPDKRDKRIRLSTKYEVPLALVAVPALGADQTGANPAVPENSRFHVNLAANLSKDLDSPLPKLSRYFPLQRPSLVLVIMSSSAVAI